MDERRLRRWLDRELCDAEADAFLASLTGANQIEIAPDGTKRLVGPVISLSDPLPGASDQLAGGDQASAPGWSSSSMVASGGAAARHRPASRRPGTVHSTTSSRGSGRRAPRRRVKVRGARVTDVTVRWTEPRGARGEFAVRP